MLRGRAGAFVATVIGVGVVALSTLLFASAQPRVPDRFARAAVVVRGRPAQPGAEAFAEPVPWPGATATALASRLAGIAGVASAVPDRTFYAQVVVGGRPDAGVVEGHGWSSAGLGIHRLRAGGPPQRDRDVVLDAALGLRPGTGVTLLTASGPASYTVSGVLDGPGIYVADRAAAMLAPGVRAIGLTLRPGADVDGVAESARRTVGTDGVVLAGAARSALESRQDARTRWIGMQVLTAVAVLATFVTVFIVASTFAFNVAQRRRQLGLLRAIGATPRQLRRMLYHEGLAVGASASVAGTLLGAVLAAPVGRLLVDVGFEPAGYGVRLAGWPVAVSLAAGPVLAMLGVWSASRRASRVRPLEALREAAVEGRPMGRLRWVLGVLVGAAGLALAAGTATSGDPAHGGTLALYSAIALMLAAAVLAPAVVPPVVRLLTWPLVRGRGASGLLAREAALTAPRRTASTAAPVLLTVGFAVLVSGMVRTSTGAYAAGRAARIEAGAVVVPDNTPGLSDAAIARVPGTALLPTTVYTQDQQALDAVGMDRVAFADLRGSTVVLTTSAAAAHPGGRLPVTFADGEVVPLTVAAVVPDRAAPAPLLLPRDLVRAHDPSALASAVLVPAPVSLPAGSGARVLDVAAYAAEQSGQEDRLVWIFTLLLIGVSAGYGAIAVANTLLMAAAHRVREFQLLRLCGATTAQVARVAVAEAALVVTVGTVLGGLVAATALVSIRAGLSVQVHAPVDLVVPWDTIGGVIGMCLLLATAASLVPVRRAVRARARTVAPDG